MDELAGSRWRRPRRPRRPIRSQNLPYKPMKWNPPKPEQLPTATVFFDPFTNAYVIHHPYADAYATQAPKKKGASNSKVSSLGKNHRRGAETSPSRSAARRMRLKRSYLLLYAIFPQNYSYLLRKTWTSKTFLTWYKLAHTSRGPWASICAENGVSIYCYGQAQMASTLWRR